MADYQRVVEFLRDIRTAPPGVPTEELRNFATQYANLCHQANERLRRGSEFLQKSLRSEAIHLAEETPNLLDLVAALDLPDPDLWADYCRMHDLPVPETLQMDRANQLQDAYAADQPIAALLDQHRLLALTRAPVGQRLAVLREIAAQDPTGNWDAELRLLEKARIAELPNIFYNAVKNRDFAAITELYDEVNGQPWREDLPPDYLQTLKAAYLRMQQAQVQTQIETLLPELQAAYATRQLTRCVDLLKEAKNLMDKSGVEGFSSTLAEQIEPITTWVKQEGLLEKRRKEAAQISRELERQLNADAPDADLLRVYTKLSGLPEALPPELEQRYQETLRSRNQQRGQRHQKQLVAMGITAAIVLVLIIGGVWLFQRSHGAENWARSIEAAVEARDLPRAEKLVQDLNAKAPQLIQNTKVQLALSHVETLKQQFHQATARLEETVTRLQTATATAQQTLEQKENSISTLLTAAELAQSALQSVDERLEWADAQRHLKTAQSSLTMVRDQLNRTANQLALARVTELSQKLTTATQSADFATLGEALHELNTLRGLAASTHQSITSTLASLEQKRQLLEKNRTQTELYESLPDQAFSIETLQTALESFTTRFPEAPASSDFKQALNLIPAAKAVEAWHETVHTWADTLAPASAALAQERLTALQTFQTNHPDSPLAAPATAYANYLTSALAALADKPGDGTWAKAFHDLLDMPLLTELSYLETNAGNRYYLLGEYKPREHRINDQVTLSFEALNPRDFTKTTPVTVEPPLKLTTAKPQPMPHTLLAQEISEQLRQIDEKNWENFGITLAAKIAATPAADPVVRAQFLQTTLQAQLQISGPFLGDIYERTLRDLARQEPEKLIWYNQDKPLSANTVRALEDIFSHLPKPVEVLARLKQNKNLAFADLHWNQVGTGVILHDVAGKPLIKVRTKLQDGDRCFTLKARSTGSPKLVQIAHYQNQTLIPDDAETTFANLLQGSPVFVLRP